MVLILATRLQALPAEIGWAMLDRKRAWGTFRKSKRVNAGIASASLLEKAHLLSLR
jgi:hypothetical protein